MARFSDYTRKSVIPVGLPKLELGYNRVFIPKTGSPFDSSYNGQKTVRVKIPFQTLESDAELPMYFNYILTEDSYLTQLFEACYEEFNPFDTDGLTLKDLDKKELIVLVEDICEDNTVKRKITEFISIDADIETIN